MVVSRQWSSPPPEAQGSFGATHDGPFAPRMTPSTHRSKAGTGNVLVSIRHLVVGSNFDALHVPILNSLMSKVLADVDVLGTLASAHNMVFPFDACCTVRWSS